MLNVLINKSEVFNNCIWNTSVYFDNSYKDVWFDDTFARQMLLAIDKSRVITDGVINGPIGNLTYDRISGGLKTLLLIYNIRDKIFNASKCGDNCAEWLLKIADKFEQEGKGDVTIVLYHLMHFCEPFKIKVLNNNTIVTNSLELSQCFTLFGDKACGDNA